MHHLVIGALEEGGIDGAERAQPFGGHAGSKGDGMLLGNAHIKKPVRVSLGKGIQPRARRHGGGDGGNLVVGSSTACEFAGEHGGVARRACGAFFLLTGNHVELGNGVILVSGFFGRLIAVAFFRDDMQHDGAVIRIAQVAQDRDQLRQVMPIHGANVVKAQFFKQGAAGDHAAGIFIGLAGRAFHGGGQFFHELAGQFAQSHELAGRHQARQVVRHGPHRWGNGHLVVVQDDNQPFRTGASHGGVVHGLIRHTGGNGAITNHGNHIAFAVAGVFLRPQVVGHGHAESGGNGGGGMGCAKRIVFAFRAAGKAGQATRLAQGADPVTSPGQNLVRVGLVAHIPDHLVIRGVKHRMQGNCQLHNTQGGPKVPPRGGNRVHRFGPQLIRNLLELLNREIAQVRRILNPVQRRKTP
ncbi:hypothetical protein NBRC3280_3391 [Acetobacter pasteurianus NBRC 3280]|nr:hypothetical protein NBRC3280_3391 [Acetobacter pasteurianus NBRC 3280]